MNPEVNYNPSNSVSNPIKNSPGSPAKPHPSEFLDTKDITEVIFRTIPQTILGSPAPLGTTDWMEGNILTPLPPRTLEMLAGDPALSGDSEPDKTPTATVVRGGTKGTGRVGGFLGGGVLRRWAPTLHAPECCLLSPQTSETSHWSGPSPESTAPLTGRGFEARA